jgi:hypothetical protein
MYVCYMFFILYLSQAVKVYLNDNKLLLYVIAHHCIPAICNCKKLQSAYYPDHRGFMVFNVTFNNISVISWRSVLLEEETGGPGENHLSVASH